MSVLDRLATALDRNDERPNVELAQQLAASGDAAAIAELAGALKTAPAALRNDALKTLYEIGYRRPELIVSHIDAIWPLLASSNNRSVWGALQAIETVAPLQPDAVLAHVPAILAAADKGSVIAKDKAVLILVILAGAGHAEALLPILLDRLAGAAPNQFPTYAEAIATVITPAHRPTLAEVLTRRLGDMAGAKRARAEKLLRKLARPA
jgi:hypothetical protein